MAICGEIMTMPGLPRVPAANSIFVNEAGQVEGKMVYHTVHRTPFSHSGPYSQLMPA